jgi:exodeoxyribonuclease VII large subunit
MREPVAMHAAVYSVAELDRRLKRAVEGASAEVWVEGEVSNAKPAPSGHVYFCLKDEIEDAILECVMYRSASVTARRLIVDGARVMLRGRATIWAPRGRLQFIGDVARLSGRGALLEALEALKAKLQDEGLFAAERKRPLPTDPAVIGVVTSASGAAIHDIAKVAFRRGGVRILLSSTLVQGQAAALRVVLAIDLLERVKEVEVIILGRGGGSSEDLMVFNDEQVVRRVAACRVPIVSAVGHEVDITLTDLVADARAATPSQAAEMVVPDGRMRRGALAQLDARLARAMRNRLREDSAAYGMVVRDLLAQKRAFAERRQIVDDRVARLRQAMNRRLSVFRVSVERLHRRLSARHPRAVVAQARSAFGPLEVRLESAMQARIEASRGDLQSEGARLDALSPLAVLSRGYAIAVTTGGRAIRSSSEVKRGDTISVRVHRGTFRADVTESERALPGEEPS